MILWSLLAPLGAVAYDRPGRAWPWFAAFVATMLLSIVLAEVVRPDGAELPSAFVGALPHPSTSAEIAPGGAVSSTTSGATR